MSAMQWTSKIPTSWRVVPLRAVADYEVSNVDKLTNETEERVRLCNYVDVYHNEFITLGLDFMEATATPSEVEKFGVRVDDVIITKDSESWDDIGVPAHVREAAPDLVCGYHLAQIRPRSGRLSGSFLFRCLQSKPIRLQLELAANGVTRFGLPKAAIGATRLPLPPLDTQRAIANFLDAETARIDALIAAKENLLTILAEKRRALSTQTVIRGLDPSAPMRDSGIPWLGEIPAHWEVVPLRWFARIGSGDFIQSSEVVAEPDEVRTIPVVGGNGVNGFTSEANVSSETVVIGRVGALCGNVHLVGGAAWVTDNALRLRDIRGFMARYLRLVLLEADLNAMASRTAQPLITGTQVMDLRLPLPPSLEQSQIVAKLDEDSAAIERLHTATSITLKLLRERREAVIAAAVTGQLDVGVK